MAKKIIGKIAQCPGKYGDTILCKIVSKGQNGEWNLKDINGNNYVFVLSEVEILEEVTEDIIYPFIIKNIMKENMVIDVKEEDVEDFLNYAKMAGYTTGNPDNLGYGPMSLYNGSIYKNAPIDKMVSFDTIKKRIFSCGGYSIQLDMVEEINKQLEKMGSPLILTKKGESELDNISVEIVLRNNKFISTYYVSPTDELLNYINSFFKKKEIELIYNNTRTIFWSKNGYSKRPWYFA